jgi:S-adenosylmethionine-diacylglycerol 3-amino-3-carboxypropyl transferase
MNSYFQDLNYSLSNEDTKIESDLLARLPTDKTKVLAVCGAGARVTPLMHSHVSQIHVVDISEPQLKLLRLRLESIKKFDHAEFLQFWGYQPTASTRLKMINSLNLTADDSQYWKTQSEKWENGFLLTGRWENFLTKLGKMFRDYFFVNFESLFECSSPGARKIWFNKNFPQKRLQIFLKIFANPFIFNLFLYRGKFASSKESFSDFLNQVFHQILIVKDPKRSFFAQMLFLGKLKYAEGWPIEAQIEVFERSKKFQGEIIFHQTDLVDIIEQSLDLNFLSLSDVVSYLSEVQLARLEKALCRLEHKQTTVMRSFRRHPQFSPDFTNRLNFEDIRHAEQSDSIGVYKFHIFSHH